MARVAKARKTTRSAPTARKIGRPPAVPVAAKRKPGRPAKVSAAALPAPKISKDELRANVGKLEQLVATLRAKSREANKAVKAATARIAELEAHVARLEKRAAAAPTPVGEPKAAKRRGRAIDPGDAVPSGVAVQDPQPLDDEAETAHEHLDAHLSHY